MPKNHIELIARGVLLHDTHILLCRNVKHNYYYLPGGHIEFGEPAARALAREFHEETGLTINVGELALVTEGAFTVRGKQHHELNLVFHVERHGDDDHPIQSREADIAFEWIDLAAILDTDVRPAAIRAWLTTLGSTRRVSATAEWVSEIQHPSH